MIITSAAPFEVEVGQPIVLEEGWGCSERLADGVLRHKGPGKVDKRIEQGLSKSKHDAKPVGQTVLVVATDNPVRVRNEQGAELWETRLRAENVPPSMATDAFDLEFNVDPDVSTK